MKNSLLKSDPDITRGTDKSCLDCQKKFSIMVREHQCKRCLKPVCSDCGSYRRQVYSANFVLRDHRVCKSCKSASEEISNYVKSQDLRFASMSDIGKKWLKKITKKPSTFGTDVSQHKQFTRQYFGELWGSYSFELRQLIGILTFKIQQDGIYSVVYGVYTTVISAAPQYKLPQVIHLIVFVLCFCDADKVPFVVLYLLQLKQNQKDIKQVAYKYLKALPFTTQLTKLEEIINYRLERFADSFLVNCLTIDMSIYLINRILQRRNIEEMFIIFATHIFINREMLVSKYKEDKLLLDNLMLRKCLQPSQLIANAKFFKGKQFAISNQENSDTLGYLSLRKAQTLNLDVQLSPNNSLLETYDIKIQPVFVNRSSAQLKNSKDNIQDSFSMYLEANDKENTSLKLSPSSPNIKDGKNVLESMQYSPQSKSIENIMDSPFRKMVAQDFGEDLPQLTELSKTARKNTDGPDISQARNCQKCSLYLEEIQTMSRKTKQEREKWLKEKQSYELAQENMSENVNKLVEENFNAKTRIKELQTTNNQHQNHIKTLLQKLKISQEENTKKNELMLQMKEEKKQLNEKLMKQSNQNVKLYAQIQQEKRTTNEAKERLAEEKRNTEGMKIRLKNQEETVEELKRKIASLTNELQQVVEKGKRHQKEAQQLRRQVIEMKEKNDKLEKMMQRKGQVTKGQTVQLEQEKLNKVQQKQIKRLRQSSKSQQITIKELNIQIKGLEDGNQKLRKEYQLLQKRFEESVQNVSQLQTKYEDQIRAKELLRQQKQEYERSIHKIQEAKRKELQQMRLEMSKEKERVSQLLQKMKNISQLMMEIQAEKMEMADELFNLNQFIKVKGLEIAD